jgi:N-methylhydantoinase A/oxoprolinase/acetone carboxylase beta subunit
MASTAETVVAAVDVGGTFTDVAVWDGPNAALRTYKLLTTPDDVSRAVMDGLHAVGLEVAAVVHGTTLVTNALIERRGAVVGLITTHGFRDVLEIGNELRYDMFDLKLTRPEPIVPRKLRRTARERISSEGEVVLALDLAGVEAAARALLHEGVEAIALGFLNAYANPVHELAAAERIRALFPEVRVSTSAEVSGEVREYERISTTAANAYVQPLTDRYLGELSRRLDVPLFLMLSDGTISTVHAARQYPISMVESGPAAGAIAAAHLARESGWQSVMALDMGGTTAKLSLVHDAQPQLTRTLEVARVHRFKKGSGLPLRVPTVDLLEIGAGGGSIARVDALGLLKVGPESAGAAPGPACYALGGVEPTVTDADLVLGYISPEGLVGGRLPLDYGLARAAVGRLAGNLGLEIDETAAGIVDVVNTHMATAARIHLAEHGRDPRRYRLVAFGGAGPVHAFSVARLLGIDEVVFPRDAGVASAIGMLVAPRGVERVRTWRCLLDRLDWNRLEELLSDLEGAGRDVVRQSHVADDEISVDIAADIRYAGQGHELTIVLDRARIRERDSESITQAFTDEYRRRYGLVLDQMPIEVVSWRVRTHGPAVSDQVHASGTPGVRHRSGPSIARRSVFFREGGLVEVPVRTRSGFRGGETVDGPALIEEETTTCVIGPGWTAALDAAGNLVMRSTA